MNETDFGLPAKGISSVIPLFFFDVIGRMVPGSFLIVGLYVLATPMPAIEAARACLKLLSSLGAAGGFFILLAFLASAYFAGFYLGSLSHYCVEKWWVQLCPWKESDIPEDFWLRRLGGGRYRVRLPGGPSLSIPETEGGRSAPEQVAEICGYFAWATTQTLGVLSSRWDAEALASRSVLLAAVFLSIAFAAEKIWGFRRGEWEVLALFVAIALGAFLSYRHHRRQRVIRKMDSIRSLPSSRRRT